MSVEPRRVAKTEVWTDWESRVINGLFPLRRFLGGSDHSAVFLTEYKAENLPDAAIKFVPADTLHAEAQLVQWGTAATLSHPHLVRLFDVGRCQFGGRAFLYVVMEYAEQTLAQILPKRALSPEEALEMMLPTLDALTFLHQNSLVHGHLKPSNFLVVNDQLKLSSDTIRASGSSANNSINPGNAATGTASDIWDLGITLVEALTQRTPIWTDDRSETAILPVSLPLGFVDTVRRCLSRNPADRPSVVELEARYSPAPHLSVASAAHPAADEEPHETTPSQQSPQRSLLVPAVAAVFLLALGAFAYLRYLQSHSSSQQVAVLAQDGSQEASSSPAGSPATTADGTSALPAGSAIAHACRSFSHRFPGGRRAHRSYNGGFPACLRTGYSVVASYSAVCDSRTRCGHRNPRPSRDPRIRPALRTSHSVARCPVISNSAACDAWLRRNYRLRRTAQLHRGPRIRRTLRFGCDRRKAPNTHSSPPGPRLSPAGPTRTPVSNRVARDPPRRNPRHPPRHQCQDSRSRQSHGACPRRPLRQGRRRVHGKPRPQPLFRAPRERRRREMAIHRDRQ